VRTVELMNLFVARVATSWYVAGAAASCFAISIVAATVNGTLASVPSFCELP
jgi:hypothetical protein